MCFFVNYFSSYGTSSIAHLTFVYTKKIFGLCDKCQVLFLHLHTIIPKRLLPNDLLHTEQQNRLQYPLDSDLSNVATLLHHNGTAYSSQRDLVVTWYAGLV